MPKFQEELRIRQGVPSNPATGETSLYADPSTGNLFQKKPDGAVLDLSTAGGGGGAAETYKTRMKWMTD